MMQQSKSQKVAFIREAECIGCTKCIDVCPVDAILGTAKEMHTVIVAECIGCKLCIPPCPVDCIEMITLPFIAEDHATRKQHILHIQHRFRARKERLAQQTITTTRLLEEKKLYIAEAVLRVKTKKKKGRHSIPFS